MSTYFILANWTEQGIKDVKASPKRLRAAKRLAKDCGVKFKSFHMTLGQYDIIVELLSKVGDAGFRRRVRLAFLRP